MNDTPTAADGATSSTRLHVADEAGQTIAVADLSLADGDLLTVQLHGEARAHELVPYLEGLGEQRDHAKGAATAGEPDEATDDAQLKRAAKRLTNILSAAGYTVSVLPAGDVQVQGILDLRSGRAFATHSLLNPLAADAPTIVQAVSDALAGLPAKFCHEVVEAITTPLANGDHAAAAIALCDAGKAGRLGFADSSVLEAAYRIEVRGLAKDTEKLVRLIRIGLSAKVERYPVAEEDTNVLLKWTDLSFEERASLHVGQGIMLQARGAVHAAIVVWRKVANNPALTAGVRAWAWRNLSLALPSEGAEAIRAARASADAFLEDGAKGEAVTSLLRLFTILENHDLRAAAQELESLHGLVNTPDLWGQMERAALHHALGNRFAAMRQHERALSEAEEAIALRRGVNGAEEELISSLHLAALEAKALERKLDAEAFEAEAEALTDSSGSQHFQIAKRIQNMSVCFDALAAPDLIADARASGNPDVWVAAEVAVAMGDPTLEMPFRLARLEELEEELHHPLTRFASRKLVGVAIAITLSELGDWRASADRLKAMLDEDPGALDIRDRLGATLQQAEQWGDLASLMSRRLALEGEMPGLMTVYGRALLEAGEVNGALTVLNKARQMMPADHPNRSYIAELRDRALDLGGTPVTPAPTTVTAPVLRTEFTQALENYRHFISSAKRMSFWRGGPDHRWVEQPERKAQDLLHTALKARFDDRIEVFEELGSGAGRLDLLVRLQGGLKVILELKLCGCGYSATYAASGEDQIRHYMAARDVHLGYLVVHDARLTGNGRPLLTPVSGPDTVFEFLIDVTPRMPKKRGRTNGGKARIEP